MFVAGGPTMSNETTISRNSNSTHINTGENSSTEVNSYLCTFTTSNHSESNILSSSSID